jgi:hypothetical protein
MFTAHSIRLTECICKSLTEVLIFSSKSLFNHKAKVRLKEFYCHAFLNAFNVAHHSLEQRLCSVKWGNSLNFMAKQVRHVDRENIQ